MLLYSRCLFSAPNLVIFFLFFGFGMWWGEGSNLSMILVLHSTLNISRKFGSRLWYLDAS